MEPMVEIHNLTRDYGDGRGLFGLSLEVARGEAVGLMGVNGAGKTTLIRHVMGFLAARGGSVRVRGLDAWRDAPRVKRKTGYVPGEIAFPDVGSGDAFLALHARYLGGADLREARGLARLFELDTAARLRSMSKGMKQKTALVAAFMGEPDLLVLDEPTTGLDPVMQRVFIDLVRRARARGATVLMSSHLSDELEAVCDRVALMRDAHTGALIGALAARRLRWMAQKPRTLETRFKDAYQNACRAGTGSAGTRPTKGAHRD